MGTAVIAPFLATSLYQAISEALPVRVWFYESWLTPRGFRAKHVYVSGVQAIFSFLRHEHEQYDAVMRRAGSLSARWVHDGLTPFVRWPLHALPRALRARAALRLARHVVRRTWSESRVRIRWRGRVGTFAISRSLFCAVREAAPQPLCGFYAAVVETCLEIAGVAAEVGIVGCLASGNGECVVRVTRTAARRPGADAGRAAAALVAMAGALAQTTVAAQAPAASGAAERAVAAQDVPAPAPRPLGGGGVLVMPFENASRQPGLAWLSEGSALVLADEFRRAGLEVMAREERRCAFDRLQVPPRAALSRATVVRIGDLIGADEVVTGALMVEAGDLVLRARRIHLESGRMDAEQDVRGPLAELPGLYRELAARLLGAGPAAQPGQAEPAGLVLGVPPAAFEQCVKGLIAESPAAQTTFLSKALDLHPEFPEARLALAQSRLAAGDYRLALDALGPIMDSASHGAEAGLVAALAHIALGSFTPAYQVLAALQARAPSAPVLNNLGVVRLRAGSLPPGAGSAVWYFDQARRLEPLEPDYLFNLGYAHWLDGSPQGAGYWLREAVRLAPTDSAAHALLARALAGTGQPAEAARELALAGRLSSAFEGIDLQGGWPPRPPGGLERLKDSMAPRRARRIDAAIESAASRDQRDLAAFYLERGRRAFERESDRDAESDLRRALYLSPYEAEAHLLLGRSYLRTGRLQEAIDAFKVSIWSRDTAAARLALAEAYLEARDPAACRAEAERALALDPGSVHARQLLDQVRPPSAPPV